jgi:hypothetical protein
MLYYAGIVTGLVFEATDQAGPGGDSVWAVNEKEVRERGGHGTWSGALGVDMW